MINSHFSPESPQQSKTISGQDSCWTKLATHIQCWDSINNNAQNFGVFANSNLYENEDKDIRLFSQKHKRAM